jgi:hypothetical protein
MLNDWSNLLKLEAPEALLVFSSVYNFCEIVEQGRGLRNKVVITKLKSPVHVEKPVAQ